MNEFLPRRPTHGQQKRSKHRAPHGSPEFSSRVGGWVTEEQYQFFHYKGGSIWLRSILSALMVLEKSNPVSPKSKEKA